MALSFSTNSGWSFMKSNPLFDNVSVGIEAKEGRHDGMGIEKDALKRTFDVTP